MKFLYSSMFIDEDINDIESIIDNIGNDKVELILDSNICIFLRDFYKEPSVITARTEIWGELKKLLYLIEYNDLEVDFYLGLEESSRSKSNFEIIEDKFFDAFNALSNLFSMDYLQMIEHSKLIKFDTPIKDNSLKQPSKMKALEQSGVFQNQLFLNYACLLKLYLLVEEKSEWENVDKMKLYLDFLEEDLDFLGATNILFGHLLLSGEDKSQKLIHPQKKKRKQREEVIHAIWNAAIDLTFPVLVTQKFFDRTKVPIFVTGDENCWRIFNSLKMRAMITDNNGLATSPFVEMDLSNTLWNNEELLDINQYHDAIIDRRKYYNITRNKNLSKILEALRVTCYGLEKEVRELLA
ncbi:hypothetical protein [Lysinibacillus xylanilyticus]|uniref:hypothetical protein n=1 Tax=Lysinibacillus xylanilyticus TaxID=582475 RepID=UPI00083CA37C|nr:hypothetical protein [Lysinibacillus xylanilyticus]